MNIVILVAGMSTRLKEYTRDIPKCLLQIGGKSIIEHQLDVITQIDKIDKIIIVTGYKSSLIKEKIGKLYNGKPILYINNDLYDSTEMNYSLYLTKEIILRDSFIYLTGDTLFSRQIILMLLENENENCIMVDRNIQSNKVDAIVTGKGGVVFNLIAHIHGDLSLKINNIPNVIGEPLMMVRFNSNYARLIINAIERTGIKSTGKHLMYIFSELFKKNKIYYQEFIGFSWIEIDNKDDLVKANSIIDSILI